MIEYKKGLNEEQSYVMIKNSVIKNSKSHFGSSTIKIEQSILNLSGVEFQNNFAALLTNVLHIKNDEIETSNTGIDIFNCHFESTEIVVNKNLNGSYIHIDDIHQTKNVPQIKI